MEAQGVHSEPRTKAMLMGTGGTQTKLKVEPEDAEVQ